MKTLLKNIKIFNGYEEKLITGLELLINGEKIEKIAKNIQDKDISNTIDGKNQVLMPGLIDNHVHITATTVTAENVNSGLMYAKGFEFLKAMLKRGFTTVRDAGGADVGIKEAIEKKVIKAPRLFMAGRALSQTGGHGDLRNGTKGLEPCACSIDTGTSLSIICDGVGAVRKAARENFRLGADQIKIMASGGIASPSDRVRDVQFSEEEIRAIVEEATNHNTYVMAHAYTPEAISRCALFGVKSIEHGNLLDEASADLMKKFDMALVPTLAVYEGLYKHGKELGMHEHVIAKLNQVRASGLKAIQIARKKGVRVGLGTDLLGDLHQYQGNEFTIRSQIESAFETLNSATEVNADIVGMKGELGVIKEGAFADMILLDKNPLEDISILDSSTGEHIELIILNGEVVDLEK